MAIGMPVNQQYMLNDGSYGQGMQYQPSPQMYNNQPFQQYGQPSYGQQQPIYGQPMQS